MKITEVVNGVYCYVATVRAKRGKAIITAKTIIFADGISQARSLLIASYGENSVLAISRISDSQLDEAVPNKEKILHTAKVLPTAYTHKLAQNALLAQMKRNSLKIKPTRDDLKSAHNDFDAEQKRVNREYQNAVNDREKWTEIRKKRLNK